ncbi:uncharacterized protein LOC113793351 [Dermatophagoides pteronyssinus]|uniref:uncharacterized protein LOC113793351 n=1 Tax=Dermatophagoides pteronyssinus TaxID=6956 RepID=UPI003F68137E
MDTTNSKDAGKGEEQKRDEEISKVSDVSKIFTPKSMTEIEADRSTLFTGAKHDASFLAVDTNDAKSTVPTYQPSEVMSGGLMSLKEEMPKIDAESKTNTNQRSLLSQNDRLDSIGSEMSLGFEIPGDADGTNPQSLVIRDGPELYQTILRTVCAYAIRCSHGQMPIQKLKNHTGYWLPFAYANEDEKYSKTIDIVLECFQNETKPTSDNNNKSTSSKSKETLAKILTNVQLYNIHRSQIPDGQFVSRYIFLAQWNNSNPNYTCCKENAHIKWLPLAEAINSKKIADILWGNEVNMTATVLNELHLNKPVSNKFPNISEFTSSEVLKYTTSTTISPNRSATTNQTLVMLSDAKFTEKDVIKVYCEFIQHCYPSANMTYCAFAEYINKMDLLTNDENIIRSVYRAISPSWRNRNFMFFNEFLLGLAALDSSNNTPLRCGYIFRYYDQNSDSFLDEEDFKKIVFDIRDASMMSTEPAAVQKDCQTRLTHLKLMDDKKRITSQNFTREVTSGRLTGVGQLFRANRPVLETIHSRHLYEYIFNKNGKPFAPKLLGTCPKCRPKTYSLAYNAVKLSSQGRIEESRPLIQMNCGEIDVELQFKKKTNEIRVKHSMEVVFNENSVANQVLSIIRRMVDFNKLPHERKTEVAQYVINKLTVDLIVQLCKEVTEILLIEPRVVKVNSPCIVLGDLHGNINDLLTYERQLWPLAPTANAPNILFLGDYVDRGDYSIEVISYLFAMKILAPTKFFLLRGNHEIRSIQRNFTFARECMVKYLYQNGQRVLEEFNQAFDHLPLVGIIDESIFCAHGGIPYSVAKIEDLYKIPLPLPEPEIQSKPAWEILWSDPVTDEEFNQVCQFKNQSTETGFVDNLRRSTGYYFAEKASRNFLKANNLSHIIRAHELETDGYRFRHSGLLITVFSSSRYCNTNNKSAAVFVNSQSNNEGFIKVIALET